ncbi:vitamin K epoxide reductase family protein [Candidatus Parcubacteria bacterium]|nr:vitamin K epoxide reductase family protein [Candidatus Parcubacteria bacterium]
MNKLVYSFIVVALVGLLDAVFLTVKHYTGDISCSLITGCQEVLSSSYSVIFGIPTALLGAGYYIVILLAALIYAEQKKGLMLKVLSYLPTLGFLFSLWLIYLMMFVIEALCQYCLLSAMTSTLLFIFSLILIKKNK